MMFVDRIRVWARGGKGGNGCCSFRREKFAPMGGPDGGDGGKGGDVVIEVNPHLNNLVHLRFKPHHFAPSGSPGRGSQCTGRGGKILKIEVPPGTVISRLPSTESEIERSVPFELAEPLVDLTQPGEKYVLCRGGKGGRGNLFFKSSNNKAPTEYEPGSPGEYGQFSFELKSIADVGLVGYPNAGKSSLLRAVSAATPKVAPYPFTTLAPFIGVVENDSRTRRFTMADIPGLIEGASEGVGLGHDFLRHIERCALLVFVLDMSGQEDRDPLDDFAQLRKEIKNYDLALSERNYLIVANKMDIPESAENLRRFKTRYKMETWPLSTATGEGVGDLVNKLFELTSS